MLELKTWMMKYRKWTQHGGGKWLATAAAAAAATAAGAAGSPAGWMHLWTPPATFATTSA